MDIEPFDGLEKITQNKSRLSLPIRHWEIKYSVKKRIININNYYLQKNIKLRKYQITAVLYCLYIMHKIHINASTDELIFKKDIFKRRLLAFDMATGSGKTIIMATIMMYLYLYENQSRFLYIIDTKNIEDKTKDNFWTSRYSNKCLFNINNPKKILIKDTKHLDDYKEGLNTDTNINNKNTANIIYISMVTSQKLIKNFERNSNYARKFTNVPIIIFADEAQHNNALTKNKNKSVKSLVKNDSETFEATINKLRESNPKNVELDFSGSLATLMNSNKNIKEKYNNKIVYYYPFNEFENDGYSKRYMVFYKDSDSLSISNDQREILADIIYKKYPKWFNKHLNQQSLKYNKYLNKIIGNKSKMLSAIFLNTYRCLIINDIKGLSVFDPLILFKSNNIQFSLNSELYFSYLVNKLNINNIKKSLQEWLVDNVTQIKKTNNIKKEDKINYINPISIVYKYFKYNYIDSGNTYKLVNFIKERFYYRRIINANANNVKGINILNNLDDINLRYNKYNVIFAVNKLSEGWDVKSLFDIVRLQGSSSTASLNAEVQLMGRGSRYYPFKYYKRNILQNIFDKYRRCFDYKSPNINKFIDYGWLETLSYHTVANTEDKFKKILESNDIEQVRPPRPSRKANINKYLLTNSTGQKIFNSGRIYLNYSKRINKNIFNNMSSIRLSLPKSNNNNNVYIINLLKSPMINNMSLHQIRNNNNITYFYMNNIGVNFNKLLRNAMSYDMFFRYNNLSKFININSINEFITKWLKNISLRVICHMYYDTSFRGIIRTYILALSNFLFSIKDSLIRIYNDPNNMIGTNEFYPKLLRDIISPYSEKVDGVYNISDKRYELLHHESESLIKNESSSDMQQITIHYLYSDNNDKHDAKYYAYDESICNNLEHQCINCIIHSVIPTIIKNSKIISHALLVRTDQVNKPIMLHDFESVGKNIQRFSPYQPDFVLLLFDNNFSQKNAVQFYIEAKGEQLLNQDKWKENLLNKIKPSLIRVKLFKPGKNQINNNINNGNKDIPRIYGLSFYTENHRQKPFRELYKYLKINI